MALQADLKDTMRPQNIEDDSFLSFPDILSDFIPRKPLFALNKRPWNPPTDIYETQDAIVIKMELAGARKNDMEITLDKDVLTIQGHRMEESPLHKKNYHLMEIHFGMFKRAFRIPRHVNKDNIQATYKDGFLEISILKIDQEQGSVQIIHEEE
ncbi:Hsp20/alpha crystallin family protein [Candidatus Sumerlaeota bacterium]|nr:Hsp20/alpha crystallin family protein [Candidatus Sumerlaeota bacterium]